MSEAPSVSLFLIPNTLGDVRIERSLPPYITSVVAGLQHFLAEEEKSARRLIKHLVPDVDLRSLSIERLDEHTKPEQLHGLLSPLRSGCSIGVISEAGCPAIADPGADVVRKAHEMGVKVVPLIGPCSMVLALMASGLNGQTWRFQGYLPIEHDKRLEALRLIDNRAHTLGETQIIMETPYRNEKLLLDLFAVCAPSTVLCVAQGLSTDAESIRTATIKEWIANRAQLAKIPSLFLLGRA